MKTKYLLIFILIPIMALGQFTQIGSDIDGEAAHDASGLAISLSADGTILAIGAPANDGNGTDSGHVRVYQYIEGSWMQIGTDINGEAEEDYSGGSVSLSADGSILAVGAIGNDGNGTDSGHVRVYQNIGGVWTQIGADIDGEAMEDGSSKAVSLNDDGSVVAIGAYFNDGNGTSSGQVRVYRNVAGLWTQIGEDIDGEAANDELGWSVSLSSDGSILAAGAIYNDGNGVNCGHVRVYQEEGGDWIQIGTDIDGEMAEDLSGFSVCLNADGNILAVGAVDNDGNGISSGHVRIFQNIEGEWMQLGEDIDGEEAYDELGYSLSLSYDGSVLAAGAIYNDGNGENSGHVRIYKNINGSWIQFGGDIDGEAEEDLFGVSVSLSANGNSVAIGAWLNDGNGIDSGNVRVFDLTSPLGIFDNSQLNFIVYPSPTTGYLNVISKTRITQIEIYDELGNLVSLTSNQNTIDFSGVSQGIYFVRIIDEIGKSKTQKIIKR